MRIVTDTPDVATAVLPAEWRPCGWQPHPAGDRVTLALSATLASAGPQWFCAAPPADRHEPEGFWSHVVVLSETVRPPFDVLRHDLAGQVDTLGPIACVALSGAGFQGQRGRHWAAAPGNLHLSVVVPLGVPAASHAAALSMLPAVAAIDAIGAATCHRLRAGIKWVSDVLVDGGKVAGSLTATRVIGETIDAAVFGIGLNVSVAPDVTPTPFVPVAGCLRQHPGGTHLTQGDVLRHLLPALAARVTRLRHEGPAPLAYDYSRASIVVGRRVRVWDDAATSDIDPARWPPPRAAGLVTDVGPDLRLTLQGRLEPIDSGRLAFEDACQPFGI